MSGKLRLTESETARTACARAVLRVGVDEATGEVLSQAVLAQRVGWCAGLVAGMVAALIGEHWNSVDVQVLASGWMRVGGGCRRTRGWRCGAWGGR
ncbi:hypothetical protein [Micromonospora sp. NPDC047740]|uniref:hypothetical protein n=1 Tax=Micromonospora sp. NPDC047740 TaxID=3364254 RepID=UPI003713E2C1